MAISPLAAGLESVQGKSFGSGMRRQTESKHRHAKDLLFSDSSPQCSSPGLGGLSPWSNPEEDSPGIEKQLKRFVAERVKREFAKVDGMIATAVETAVDRECRELRLKVEFLRTDLDSFRVSLDRASVTSTASGGHGTGDNFEAVRALEKQRQGMEKEFSKLRDEIALLHMSFERSQLRGRLQFVATGMLALSAAGQSEDERRSSMRALQEEEASIKVRLEESSRASTTNLTAMHHARQLREEGPLPKVPSIVPSRAWGLETTRPVSPALPVPEMSRSPRPLSPTLCTLPNDLCSGPPQP